MGESSKIEWTHHTFNPWWGCTRVSPGCEHCYAETFAKRTGLGWGSRAERRLFGEKHWRDPLKWDRDAAAAGEIRRVFCASMADVFEDRPELEGARRKLWNLIVHQTPSLAWLLLTKRPENAARMVPENWAGGWPRNVWLGFTAEDQKRYDERWPTAAKIPAVVRFVSYEPALGPINFRFPGVLRRIRPEGFDDWPEDRREMAIATAARAEYIARAETPSWVICGGESGAKARPMHPDWARSARDQCTAGRIPFFFKQWGEYQNGSTPGSRILVLNDGRFGATPRDLGWTHEVNASGERWHDFNPVAMSRVGKKMAGRDLDGRQWSEFPEFCHP